MIAKTAVIDSDVSIGENVNIWHYSTIGKGAKIGDNVTIGSYVHIGPGVIIGDGCKIQNHTSLFKGVILEGDVFIGPNCTTTNIVNPRAFIDRKHEFETTIFEKGCSVGAGCVIVCGCKIGKYALIGAGSVVTESISNNILAYGVPAKAHGEVDIQGNITRRY